MLFLKNKSSRRGAPMCAPELNFLDYGLPHFQTCPLLRTLRGGVGGGVLPLHLPRPYLHGCSTPLCFLAETAIFSTRILRFSPVGKALRAFGFSLNRPNLSSCQISWQTGTRTFFFWGNCRRDTQKYILTVDNMAK